MQSFQDWVPQMADTQHSWEVCNVNRKKQVKKQDIYYFNL
jgi:hypothetical protein